MRFWALSGQHYDFFLYALTWAGAGPNHEQTFQVIAQQQIVGTASAAGGIQTNYLSNFCLPNAGALLAFAELAFVEVYAGGFGDDG